MTGHLEATVLLENTQVEGLIGEHGLSLFLAYEHEGRTLRVLLDFGPSDAFARNAEAQNIDLATVDLAVLSHAHYDHADGMPAFFARNGHAPLYLSEACAETCWSTKGGTAEAHYIGIAPGLLERFDERLIRVATDRVTTIAPGVHLVPHRTPGLAEVGAHAGMLLRNGNVWSSDDFAHELSLVFELTPATDGTLELAVFNSCSHAGLPVIASEVCAAFPKAHIAAYVGGLHLVHATNAEVLEVASAVEALGIGHLYTGHCTGDHAARLLERELPHRVTALRPGLRFAVGA